MPVYNVEPYLKKSLESIENQTEKNFELIIVNDGSTDDSPKIIEEFIKSYSNKYKIVFINQVNLGLSEARNTGMANANGEYLYFFDSDDMLTFNAIEVMNSQLIKGIDLLKFNANQFVDSDNNSDVNNKPRPIVSKLLPNNVILKNKLFLILSRYSFQAPVWLYVYKRDLIFDNNISFKKGLIFEDELFNASVFPKVNQFIYVKERLFIRRIRPGSITTASNISKNLFNKAIVIDELSKLLKLSNNKYERNFITSRFNRIKKSIILDIDNSYKK